MFLFILPHISFSFHSFSCNLHFLVTIARIWKMFLRLFRFCLRVDMASMWCQLNVGSPSNALSLPVFLQGSFPLRSSTFHSYFSSFTIPFSNDVLFSTVHCTTQHVVIPASDKKRSSLIIFPLWIETFFSIKNAWMADKIPWWKWSL